MKIKLFLLGFTCMLLFCASAAWVAGFDFNRRDFDVSLVYMFSIFAAVWAGSMVALHP